MPQIMPTEKEVVLSFLRKRTFKIFMDFLIMNEVRNSPMSGYDLVMIIQKRFSLLLCSGSVSSMLHSLEDQHLIRGAWKEKKRVYMITPKGEALLCSAEASRGKILDLIRRIFPVSMHKVSIQQEELVCTVSPVLQ